MNTPNPLLPQGSLNPSSGKSTVRIAVFTIVTVHAVFFAGLLMQGCKRDPAVQTQAPVPETKTASELARLDPDYFQIYQENPAVTTAAPPAQASPLPDYMSTTPAIKAAPLPVYTPPNLTPPAASTELTTYSVVRGDSLYKIAKTHGITVGALTRANPGLDSNIKVGQKIQIPAPSAAATPGIGLTEPKATASNGSVHVVKPGDTLTRIARQHGTTIRALKEANNLKTERLLVGDKLKLPTAAVKSAAAPADSSTGYSASAR
jgi:LysM repeat protein